MKKKKFHPILALLALWLSIVNCNVPIAAPQGEGQDTQSVEEAAQTAMALTFAAQTSNAPLPTDTSLAPSETATPQPTPQPTACSPMVTAATNANVRSGPSTAYDVVGVLPLGGTAAIAGRNDANTWWYIDFPAGAGGHAWIAGSVTTASCLPDVVAVIAAPPLPSAPSGGGEAEEEEEEEEEEPPPAAKPDLVASGMQVWPDPATKGVPIDVMVRVTNQGTANSGHFSVQWWSSWALVGCNWSVPSLSPGETIDLECTYTYSGWSTYTIKEWVDPGDLVDESNEGNNTREDTLKVQSP